MQRGAMSNDCERFLEGVQLPALIIGTRGEMIFGNAAWRELTGSYSRDPWAWTGIVAPDECARVCREVEHALADHHELEVEFHAQGGENHARILCVELGPYMEDGVFAGLFGTARDISESRRREQQLAFMAGHDPLTGLANRRAFEESLERASSLAGRGVASVVVMLDMDHLKRYNDARGHLEGDQALVNLAMMLRSHIRASDLAARIGGDEFALLFSGASITEAHEIVERICSSARGEFVAGAREAELGLSGGIAAVEGGVDPRVVIDRADAALYAAKNRGRHRFVTWKPELGGADASGRLSSQVREALVDNGLDLVFQPVLRLSDRVVSYYESCVRLSPPGAARLEPDEFLPVVERLGLMPRLTLQVLELAVSALEENPGTAVSVNISATDIVDALLLDDFSAVVESAHLDPGRLILEIAEETLLADQADGMRWIERLAPLGCRFVLDEFGTGLGVFVLLGIDEIEQVKLSRSAVVALANSRESRQFVRAVRELIESHGKMVVAAYIETDAMLANAREAGFDYSQGYRVQKPMADLRELVALMESSP